MRLVTHHRDGMPRVGLIVDGHVIDLLPVHDRGQPTDVADVFENADVGELWIENAREAAERSLCDYPTVDSLRLLPSVRRPSKVIGVGMNYRSFAHQIGEPLPIYPILFHKTASSLAAAGEVVQIPPITDQAVPEGEVAVVIGQAGSDICVADALAHVAGYTCANDISARDLEFRTSQWTSGKMLPTFCPLGPWLVTPDEFPSAAPLYVRTMLNGREIQSGDTADMVFDIPSLVSVISSLVRLEVGDVILTGTPSDLGALEPPIHLAPGDVIRVEVEGVGALENPVARLG